MVDIDKTVQELQTTLSQITSSADFQALETRYLGRNGIINEMMKEITHVAKEERGAFGTKMNALKKDITALLEAKRSELAAVADTASLDVTLPGTQYPKGSLHLVTLAIEEISGIFEKLGFVRASYPEIEWEWFSFDALNMPPQHPARDDFETFFLETKAHSEYGRMLLTPHTSSGQPREMLRVKNPPIRMINIAKTYRPNWDVTHTPMFHQFEGLCIDADINITHLKGTIDYFAKEFFGPEREIRLRPFHFQFTEPSFEVDVSCGVCFGRGEIDGVKCRVCKSGWLELGGAGMVHPNVLKAGGIDPDKYSGWAFGFGVERNFMMKEGLKLDDIRTLYAGDIRFLEQF